MNKPLAEYVQDLKRKTGCSITEISAGTGLSWETLEALESGRLCASKADVFLLANYFNCDVSELMRVNQADRIARESTYSHREAVSDGLKSSLVNNTPIASKRIQRMKHDLILLNTKPFYVKFYIPCPELRPYIESIVYCHGHNLDYPFETVLPDGTSQMLITIGEGTREVLFNNTSSTARVSNAWITGIQDKAITYQLSDVRATVYIRIKPGGLYAFSKIHQGELNNLVIDAISILGPSVRGLWNTLANNPDPQRVIFHIETFFLERLVRSVSNPGLVTYMLNHIHLPLPALKKKTGYSPKHVTKVFQKYIGLGPKNLQRIRRFNAVINHLNQLSNKVDWPSVVFHHGYHDQAHFIKDFKHFSGLSPQNFLSLGAFCTRYIHTRLPHTQL